MDIFQHFPTELVTLVKRNGQRIEGLRALVQSGTILTSDPKLPIEDGDEFNRTLPNGIEEQFTVIDVGFQPGLGGVIPAHYQSKVRKNTAPRPAPQQVVYNLVGANSRVNNQSTDASTNVVSVEANTLFT